MHIYFLGNITRNSSQRLIEEINKLSDCIIEQFDTVNSLMKKLSCINSHPDLFLFVPSCKEELIDLTNAKEFFGEYPVVLVLPDRNKSTINTGHLLMPRFVTFFGCDLKEVKDVLEKFRDKICLKKI